MNDEEIREKQSYIWPEVIGAVITQNQGQVNLCPINYQAISTRYEMPLTICIGLGNQSQTLRNLLQTGEFTYAYPSKEQLKDIIYCGTVSGKDLDKLNQTNLDFEPATKINSPNLKEAVVNYECRVVNHYDAGTYTIVIGEVLAINGSNRSNRDKIYAFGSEEDGYGVIESVTVLQKGR